MLSQLIWENSRLVANNYDMRTSENRMQIIIIKSLEVQIIIGHVVNIVPYASLHLTLRP